MREATASPEYKGVQLTKDGKIAIIGKYQLLPPITYKTYQWSIPSSIF